MGEIWTKIRLLNAVDEALTRRNLLRTEEIRTYFANALVDTGAVRSILPPYVVERLGLAIRGQRVAEYTDGCKEAIVVTEPLIIEIEGRDTLEEALVLGDEVIIGPTVLEKLDLFVDWVNQRLVPNPAHPDQPVSKVK
jgi:clan AA aspartic protease